MSKEALSFLFNECTATWYKKNAKIKNKNKKIDDYYNIPLPSLVALRQK